MWWQMLFQLRCALTRRLCCYYVTGKGFLVSTLSRCFGICPSHCVLVLTEDLRQFFLRFVVRCFSLVIFWCDGHSPNHPTVMSVLVFL